MNELPVSITVSANGRGAVLIDGHDISHSVSALQLHADARRGAVVVLDLAVMHTVDVDGQATVGIPERTEKALVAIGWTPPHADQDGTS